MKFHLNAFLLFCLALTLTFLTSCEKDETPFSGTIELVSDKDYADCDGDQDEFTIHYISFYNDSLHILVDYSGGCGEAEFDLISSENYTAGTPTTRDLKLCLDKDDDCEALIQKEVTFDLAPIQESGQDSILINLEGYDEIFSYHY